ncbi:MAG: hypothetical protein V1647_02090, partial [Pseudomonadota bacterium]
GYLKIFLTAALVALISSCRSEEPIPGPEPAPVVNRLIFNGTATTGGDVKIEFFDTAFENILDGNAKSAYGWQPWSEYLAGNFSDHKSVMEVTITNLNYYGETISEIICASSDTNKIPLVASDGTTIFFEHTDGKFYFFDGLQMLFLEQGVNEVITELSIPVSSLTDPNPYFKMDCAGNDGSAYTVSFYTADTEDMSHGIVTKFFIEKGTIEGLIKIHRIGDGYHPIFDIYM